MDFDFKEWNTVCMVFNVNVFHFVLFTLNVKLYFVIYM